MSCDLVSITVSVILGLVILAVLMQAVNFIRTMRIQKQIKEILDDIRLRK